MKHQSKYNEKQRVWLIPVFLNDFLDENMFWCASLWWIADERRVINSILLWGVKRWDGIWTALKTTKLALALCRYIDNTVSFMLLCKTHCLQKWEYWPCSFFYMWKRLKPLSVAVELFSSFKKRANGARFMSEPKSNDCAGCFCFRCVWLSVKASLSIFSFKLNPFFH